jgi:acyl-CoA dehydrogenase
MDDLLAQSLAALLIDHSTPAAVRRAEKNGVDRALWRLVADAGYDRALAPENSGGSGLSLVEVASVIRACGQYSAPIPLGEAILAHGYARASEVVLPEGMITASIVEVGGHAARARAVPWGEGADWVLGVEPGRAAYVFPVARAESHRHPGFAACGECDMQWLLSDAIFTFQPATGHDWNLFGAVSRVAQISGALDSVLELTSRYAGERSQFGRPLAKFQAIQQQIAVLAEDTFATRMAAAMACECAGVLPEPPRVAAAKVVASEAASRACRIAHAVHGAMGFTEEYDLQLFTRRLLAWRVQYGSERYWARWVGESLLERRDKTWEFVRSVS